jgi:HSP20 family protein
MIELIRYEHPELSTADPLDRVFLPFFVGFNRPGGRAGSLFGGDHVHSPGVDLYEGADGYRATMTLPGFTKDKVKIELNNAVLTVSAESGSKGGDDVSHAKVTRSFSVPEGVNSSGIRAKMKDGMLYLHLPKDEERRPVAIDIE